MGMPHRNSPKSGGQIETVFRRSPPGGGGDSTISHIEWFFQPENIALGHKIPPKLVGTHADGFPAKELFKSVDVQPSPDQLRKACQRHVTGPKSAKIFLSRLLAKFGTGVPLVIQNGSLTSSSPKFNPTNKFWSFIKNNFSHFFVIFCLGISAKTQTCPPTPNSPHLKRTAAKVFFLLGIQSSSGEEIRGVGKASRRAPWIDTPGQGVTTSLPHHHPLYPAAARTSISSNKPHGRLYVSHELRQATLDMVNY